MWHIFAFHISRLASTCFGVLRQIRCIRRSLSSRSRTMLVTCFVFARLDYSNAICLRVCFVTLRSRPSASRTKCCWCRLIAGARKFDHVTPVLRERHWLPVEYNCFKMAVMTYECVHGTMADYLADYIRPPSSSCNCQPLPAANQFRSPVCASVKDCRRGPILCSCWSTLVEQAAYLSAGSLAIFQKQLKTFIYNSLWLTRIVDIVC